MRLQVVMFRQDDPKKCTAARMVKLGLARSVRRPGPRGLVLAPFAERVLLRGDGSAAGAVVGIDCSWSRADREIYDGMGGIKRRLPPLLAGNPVNYARLGMLTTAEAAAAALFIMGFEGQARGLLDRFRWGHTFYELNRNLLKEYSALEDGGQVGRVMRDYGLS